ncbi:Uncharacterised protein [Shimwellia blattae]|nr:Uncharacterised protein [Shimwellia blattae]VEC26854.1 Uncharacterised protein [Shimwellia blattae]
MIIIFRQQPSRQAHQCPPGWFDVRQVFVVGQLPVNYQLARMRSRTSDELWRFFAPRRLFRVAS